MNQRPKRVPRDSHEGCTGHTQGEVTREGFSQVHNVTQHRGVTTRFFGVSLRSCLLCGGTSLPRLGGFEGRGGVTSHGRCAVGWGGVLTSWSIWWLRYLCNQPICRDRQVLHEKVLFLGVTPLCKTYDVPVGDDTSPQAATSGDALQLELWPRGSGWAAEGGEP